MKKVLICSYCYPPYINESGFIGSLRISKFAKYLPLYGFEPFILAAKDPWSSPLFYNNLDPSVNIDHTDFLDPYFVIHNTIRKKPQDKRTSIDQISSGEMRKTDNKNNFKKIIRDAFVWPDTRLFWVVLGNSIAKGSRIIERENIDVIMSTSPPVTTHILGDILARKNELPWLADFRDSWTGNRNYERIGPFRVIDEFFEKRCLRRADVLTTVSKPIAEELFRVHRKPVYIIPNGFDEEDYDFNVEMDNAFTITYTGTINKIRLASLEILFEAISMMLRNGYFNDNDIKIQILGAPIRSDIIKLAEMYEIQEYVKIIPWVPYETSIKYQKASQILLSLEGLREREGVYTGKIFEYLGARRPILAIAQKGGVIDQLLKQTRAGILCCDAHETVEILLKWYCEWKKYGSIRYEGINDELQRFTRRETARRLSEVLNSLIEK